MDDAVATSPPVRTVLDVDPDRLDQAVAGVGHLADGRVECRLVAGAGLAVAAQLADVLARGRFQFAGRRRFTRTTEGLDAPAHAATVGRMAVLRQPARLLLAVIVGLAIAVVVDIARSGGPYAWLAHHRLLVVTAIAGQGERVDIGGRALYLDCRGSGAPTIVLEAGMGDGVAGWLPVMDGMAATTRTCAYDRAGRGGSDARDRHTVGDAADDLRALLAAAGEPPPYVLVGHSLGEVHARVFADRYRPEVAGLVLVDGFSVDLEADLIHPLLGELRPEYEAQAKGFRDLIAAVEGLDWPRSEAQLRAADIRGLPVVVLRAPRVEPRLDEATNTAVADAWQAAYESLSPGQVRYEIAWGAGHVIQADRPDLVITAATELVGLARE
jgi:pimeloyl-ACP methyl ester carboxylesterase